MSLTCATPILFNIVNGQWSIANKKFNQSNAHQGVMAKEQCLSLCAFCDVAISHTSKNATEIHGAQCLHYGLNNDALIQLFAMHQQKNDFSSGSVNGVPSALGG